MNDNNQILIYEAEDGNIKIDTRFEDETVWLTQNQIVNLFESSKANISEHIKHIFESGELELNSTVRNFRTVQLEGSRRVTRKRLHYNLDMIISVGYRVNSVRGTQFRIWATQRLKEYLVQGVAINEKRLAQKQQEVQYLKTGIRILNRAIEQKLDGKFDEVLAIFSKGLALLDDYDHESLDQKGISQIDVIYPEYHEYMEMIQEMYSDYESDVFAKPKDDSFNSSINQIRQSFNDVELYPTLEEKAANLLYFITKNHSFVDGNKRIAAACFLYFLEQNNSLLIDGQPIISNEALASLTLFIASSKSEEVDTVKRLIISILNRRMSLVG